MPVPPSEQQQKGAELSEISPEREMLRSRIAWSFSFSPELVSALVLKRPTLRRH